MNELIFFAQILIITALILASSRLGKAAMIAISCTLTLLANLFVLKETRLFSLEVTCADAYAVGAIVALNWIQDLYGKAEAKKLIGINFLCLGLFTATSQLHLLYKPSPHDWAGPAFETLLQFSPRLLFSSLLSYWISTLVDVRIFARLRQRLPRSFFPAALTLSIFFSQLIDTCLFSFFALYGILSPLYEMIIFSMAIKLIAIAVMAAISGIYRKNMPSWNSNSSTNPSAPKRASEPSIPPTE